MMLTYERFAANDHFERASGVACRLCLFSRAWPDGAVCLVTLGVKVCDAYEKQSEGGDDITFLTDDR